MIQLNEVFQKMKKVGLNDKRLSRYIGTAFFYL